MAININVSAEDWQATAAELAGENVRLRAAIQAAGRELNRLASMVNVEVVDSPADDDPPDDDPTDDDERKD